MQTGDFAEAIRICGEAQGTNVRVLRVFRKGGQVFGDSGPDHSWRFGDHDTPWTDSEQTASGEVPWIGRSRPFRDRTSLHWMLLERGVGETRWHCACLPHQFWSWWGTEEDWIDENSLAVIELDVNDLIVMSQQVLILRGFNQRLVVTFD